MTHDFGIELGLASSRRQHFCLPQPQPHNQPHPFILCIFFHHSPQFLSIKGRHQSVATFCLLCNSDRFDMKDTVLFAAGALLGSASAAVHTIKLQKVSLSEQLVRILLSAQCTGSC